MNPNQRDPGVIEKGNAPLHNGRRILSVRERESLEESLRIHTGILQATEQSYGLATDGGTPVLPSGMQINKSRITERARDINRVLEQGRPEPFTGNDKDRALRRAQEIREALERDNVLETRKELRVLRRDDPAWFTALDKAKKRPEFEPLIAEYRNIMRRLEPDDDTADSLDRLRKDK